jgi:outer membrane scaffolding protein for murein synthesis (MipA/OmpV family)
MLNHLRKILFLSLSLLTVLSVSAHAENTVGPNSEDIDRSRPQTEDKNWNFELGLGVMYGPKYEGSDNYTVSPFPNISVEYKNGLFFVDGGDGIGSYFLQDDNYKLGASIGFAMGRDEDDDKENLRGMGDIDTGAVGNLMGEYDFGPITISGKLTKGNEDYGMTAEADIGKMFSVSEKLMVMAKIGIKWADEDHMTTYFGVSPTQAARSGYTRYEVESGFQSVGVSVGAFYNLTKSWDVMLMVNADQLIGDAADSPITKQEFQPMVVLGTSYKF